MITDRFSSENLLMSVCGHLLLVAIMITSFIVVVDRAKLVSPDRIEIMEIDLDSVKVSGDESILYNVNPEEEPEPEPAQEEKAKQVEPVVKTEKQEPEEVQEEPIETPSLVEEKPEPVVEEIVEPEEKEEKKEEVKEEISKDETKEEAPNPKKKKTVVRVNREVVSLNRTLTVSVVDALRVAMTRCWTIDSSHEGIENIRAVAHLTMRKNGTVRDVWFESAAREQSDPAFAYVLQTIRRAIEVCQPFRMLPANEFDKWEKIQLTFYPSQGKVM